MINPQKTKKHHFVPECYLKNFIRDRNLFTLDVRKLQKGYNAKVRIYKPAMICYLEDYYKIDKGDSNINYLQLEGYDDLFIETDVLANFEQRYNMLLHAIIVQNQLCRSQAIDFSDFIVQMKLRNPYWLENTIEKYKNQWIDSSIEQIEKTIFDQNLFSQIPDEIKKLVINDVKAKNKQDTKLGKRMQLHGLIHRYFADPERNLLIRQAIVNSQWTLLKAPDNGPYFITSDNPGFSVTTSDNLIYNTRFMDNFYFHFPLSPFYCLLISDRRTDNFYDSDNPTKSVHNVQIKADDVVKINNKSIQIINKLLIASDNWYLSQIALLNAPK